MDALRVLLVDDDEVHRLVVRKLLTDQGHEVVEARDGVEALARLDHGSFDMVLMDVEMPRMDGLDATRRLRQRKDATARLPVLALTGHMGDADRERFLAAGMDAVVAKPVQADDLFGAMAAALPGRATARIPSPSRWGDADLSQLFVETGHREMQQIRAALNDGDTDTAWRIAHGLGGAAGFAGAEEVGRRARQFVEAARSGDAQRGEAACAALEQALQAFASSGGQTR